MNLVPARVRTAGRLLRFARDRAMGRRVPFSIAFMLTDRCNLACGYCDIPRVPSDEMSSAEFCRAISDLAAAGMVRASFSGGEALLRDDAIEIIGHARSLGLTTSLNTNGWLAESRLDRLAGLLDMIVFSLDGPRDLHDRNRGRQGSYDRVITGIRHARTLGIPVATMTVVADDHLNGVDHLSLIHI